MKISKESRKISKSLFKGSFTDGRLDDAKVRGIVQTVIDGKHRHTLDVLKNYQRLVRLEASKYHATIESAEPLSEDMVRQVESDLRQKHGHGLSMEFKVNPALIGGLRIQIGSNVWDGSVRNRLDRLNEELKNA